MSYLIDTNVLSELRRREPNAQVVTWMQARPRQSLYLSVLSLGEIRKGIEGVADPALVQWVETQLAGAIGSASARVNATMAPLLAL